MLDGFLHLLFPETCAGCEQCKADCRRGLCTACRFELLGHCPWPAAVLPAPEHCASLSALGTYGEVLQRLTVSFKYGNRRDLAVPLGEALLCAPHSAWRWSEISALVPVPMHPARYHERHYDHTYLLTRAVQRSLARQFSQRTAIITNALAYRDPRQAPHQATSSRLQRRRNLENALHCRFHQLLHKSQIILIDDVVTTGSTLEACAAALKNAHPEITVHALVLARTELFHTRQSAPPNNL